jgi:hypothetical protein
LLIIMKFHAAFLSLLCGPVAVEAFLSSSSNLAKPAFIQSSPPSVKLSDSERPPEGIDITSPVLIQVYPKLLEYKEQYGHPNIPLGSSEGKFCKTLRRLHIQDKLSEKEVDLLNELGFTWHSLEDVYKDVDFDELFGRMMKEKESRGNFQIPKKLPSDPELGAWVTGIRRLGKEGVDPAHAEKLDSVGFEWVSSRKCGSSFMTRYRELVTEVERNGLDKILGDRKAVAWIKAQQEALKKGKLSETRTHYMSATFGEAWTSL